MEAGKIMRWITKAEQLEGWGRHRHHCQPNSWPRWLQRLGHLCWVGRSTQEEVPIYHGRQSPPEGIPHGWQSQENLEVLAKYSCPL